jgi:cytidyltransferase-like protein
MTIAIYPGSFDPITNGHIDILKSGAKIFDKVIIAVCYNVNKEGFLPIDVRTKLIQESCISYSKSKEVLRPLKRTDAPRFFAYSTVKP